MAHPFGSSGAPENIGGRRSTPHPSLIPAGRIGDVPRRDFYLLKASSRAIARGQDVAPADAGHDSPDGRRASRRRRRCRRRRPSPRTTRRCPDGERGASARDLPTVGVAQRHRLTGEREMDIVIPQNHDEQGARGVGTSFTTPISPRRSSTACSNAGDTLSCAGPATSRLTSISPRSHHPRHRPDFPEPTVRDLRPCPRGSRANSGPFQSGAASR